MVAPSNVCDHCGSSARRFVTATIGGRELHFCCEGCLEVYRILHEFDDANQSDKARQIGLPPGSTS